MTVLSKFDKEDINREVLMNSSLIHQVATEVDESLRLRSYTYVFARNKLMEADALVLSLASKIKEIASYGSNTSQ